MKLLPANMLPRRAGAARTAVTAYSVVELMIVVMLVMLITLWLVEMQIFALRLYTLAATQTSATQSGRQALNTMRNSIRCANTAWVGMYNATNGAGFILPTNGAPQIGNALQLGYLDTNGVVTSITLYYLDTNQPVSADQPNDFPICCLNSNGVVSKMVSYVTNCNVFYAEDYRGNVLSNAISYQNNGVIHIVMQFDQWEYPIGFVGTNALNAYDFYRLTTRVTRRCKQ